MKRTKQQIISDIRILIAQTDTANSDFTDAELAAFVNEGTQYLASYIEWPRDIADIQVTDNVPAYTLLSDTMKLRIAYFGNRDVSGDCRPLVIITEERLKEIDPNWLDNTSGSKGRPQFVVLLDKATVLLHPRPDAAESVTGKKLYLSYVYYPAALVSDGAYPELPDMYHEFLSEYAAYKCYMSKLKNPEQGKTLFELMLKKAKSVQPQVTDEVTDKYFYFVYDDDYGGSEGNIADLRLS